MDVFGPGQSLGILFMWIIVFFLAQEEKSFTELFLLGEMIHKIKK